jgi:glycosyltransferase involved in cell wall biosynthesis
MTNQDLLTILRVNTSDGRGGAAQNASSLHQAFRMRGINDWLAVGYKLGSDPYTLPIHHDRAGDWWQRPFWRAERNIARRRFRGARWLRKSLLMAANPRRFNDWYQGYEDFRFPGTDHLLEMLDSTVDLLHLHNLHGDYFDLRELPRLTAQVPTVMTLHDAWLLSGHCAHSLGCERWREGCGNCPDLTIYPAIRRDATADNWRRKHDIYARSRYHIISPSQWLADRVLASPLADGLQGMRVIANGIDLNIFQPQDRQQTRHKLGLPQNSRILLMVANGLKTNPWKDFTTARAAIELLAKKQRKEPLLVILVGDSAPDEKLDGISIRSIPYVRDQNKLANFFQAADIFLNSSKIETFGRVIVEAMACAVPVVVTAVGGTPELVIPYPEADVNKATGILVRSRDAEGMASAIVALLDDDSLCHKLGQNAVRHARSAFGFDRQVERYLAYYADIMSDVQSHT